MTQIQDAYISVELKNGVLQNLRDGLQSVLLAKGVQAEFASPAIHVSIAYTQGAATLDKVQDAAEEIANCGGFQIKAKGFEILEGLSTPYDYLVVQLESEGALDEAIEVAENALECKRFAGGFKKHVSLLRIEKGSVARETVEEVVREMNASQGAALALGYCICVEGECVCVYNPQRECFLQIAIAA